MNEPAGNAAPVVSCEQVEHAYAAPPRPPPRSRLSRSSAEGPVVEHVSVSSPWQLGCSVRASEICRWHAGRALHVGHADVATQQRHVRLEQESLGGSRDVGIAGDAAGASRR